MSAALTAGAGSALDGFQRFTPGFVLSIVTALAQVWLLYGATRCLIVSRDATVLLPAGRRILG
jgi:hypothetical protein